MVLGRKQLLRRSGDIFSSLLYVQLHAKEKVKIKGNLLVHVHCATSRKATGLIPDGFIGIFH